MRRHLLPLVFLAACNTVAPPSADADAVVAPDGSIVAQLQRAEHNPVRHQQTSKVFHHVFAPDGRQLTKGAGGEYQHHRGLFVGWNQVLWRGRTFDFWHCQRGETQRFRGLVPPAELALEGPWQVAAIDWCTGDGERVLEERRALRATTLGSGETALDLVIDLRAVDGAVRVAGDPHHSGQHFRALQEFAEANGAPVRYLRPATAQGGKDDVWSGCDWVAAVLPLPQGPVTVLRIEGRDNPQPVSWSTRPYGRFGATFASAVQPGTPLRLGFRYVLAVGERDAAWCEAMAR